MLCATETARIWGDSSSERVSSARSLSGSTLAAVHEDLCEGCPVPVWPDGNATSINPLVVTLGPSPGGSPDRGVEDPAGKALQLPTAGVRHPHTTYEDKRGFWRKIRLLARTVVQSGTTSSEDSYALFGNMNLDPNRSGKASDVRIDPVFGEWVLRAIRDKLRPRFVICVGLKSKPEAVRLLSQAFDGFDSAKTARRAPAGVLSAKPLCIPRMGLYRAAWEPHQARAVAAAPEPGAIHESGDMARRLSGIRGSPSKCHPTVGMDGRSGLSCASV